MRFLQKVERYGYIECYTPWTERIIAIEIQGYNMPTPRQRVWKNGRVTWSVQYRLDSGRVVRDTFDSYRDAKQFCDLVEATGGSEARRVLDDMAGAEHTLTVREALEEHLEGLAASCTEGTIDTYRRVAANTWGPDLFDLPVQAVTRRHVTKWVASQRSRLTRKGTPYSAKTIKNAHAILSALLQTQVELGALSVNVAKGTKMPSDTAKSVEPVYLTPSEFAVLIDQVPERWRLLVALLYGTGLRWGEATALTPADFNLEARPATVRVVKAWKLGKGSRTFLGSPKTARSVRTVTLPEVLVGQLQEALRGVKRDGLVFVRPDGQKVSNGWFYRNVWGRALDGLNEAGVQARPRIHDLRHSHASNLIAANIPLPVIQRRLGHESITTTVDRYGHLAQDAFGAATVAADASMSQAFPLVDDGVQMIGGTP